jgi:CheY-like chemotaxis protein
VAEDNEFNTQLLEQLLVRRGHRVRLAGDGRKALALLEEGAFDLLLLDVHMPEMDGFQVIRAIRERERDTGGHLRVVALTARSRKEDRERCLAAGMDDFLSKPVRAADLWAAVERTAPAPPAYLPPACGLIDAEVLLAACGGDAGMLRKMCQSFQARLPEHLAAIRDALRAEDAAGLREAAHRFAGMLAVFSTAAGEAASVLEERAAQGRLDQAGPLAERIDAMSRELAEAMGNLSLDSLHTRAGSAVASDPAAPS